MSTELILNLADQSQVALDLQQIEQQLIEISKQELLPRFTEVESSRKRDGSVITEADLIMQQRLGQLLQKLCPEAVFLAEEMSPEQQADLLKASQPVWCLDPLDGTSNYAAGIPYFAVSLSLIHQQQVVFALVYDPVRDESFVASENTPAMLNGVTLKLDTTLQSLKEAMAVIDFKRLDKVLASRLATEQPFTSQRNFGASALDWCWLAAQRGHIYLHGRQNIWDYSAGQYIFRKAGGLSCTLNGEAVFVNQLVGRSVVAAVNTSLMRQWCSWLGVKQL